MTAHDHVVPRLRSIVLDTETPRALAEFYRRLLGYEYFPGHERPADDAADDADWLVLTDHSGTPIIAVQEVERLARSTWPADSVPQQLHLDLVVDSPEELARVRTRVEELGGSELRDDHANVAEPIVVFADPSGHPFCVFVPSGGIVESVPSDDPVD